MLLLLDLFPKSQHEEADPALEKKIQEREAARVSGDFHRADQIRKELLEQGIILEDGEGRTTWRRVQ